MASQQEGRGTASKVWKALTSPTKRNCTSSARERSPLRDDSPVCARRLSLGTSDGLTTPVVPVVTLSSLANMLSAIQAGQEQTNAKVAGIADSLTLISSSLESLRLNQDKLESSLAAVVKEATRQSDEVTDLKKDADAVRTHVDALDSALGSLHDSMIEAKRASEVTFVISGLGEDDNEDTLDKVKELFVRQCQLGPDEVNEGLVAVERIGRATLDKSQPRSGRGRPRLIRVRTNRPDTCRKFMKSVKPKLHSLPSPWNKVYVNEDLSYSERQRMSQLLPVYRKLKAAKTDCRMDRDRLIADGNVFRAAEPAEAFLRSLNGMDTRPPHQERPVSSLSQHRP